MMTLAAVAIYRKGFGLTFFYDEWTFIFERREWSLGSFLEPHGEHIALVPAAVYKALFLAVGLEEYWVYRLIILLTHLVCVVLVYVLALRRVSPALAAIAAIAILALGSAWQDLLWPFQIGFLTSIAAGLGALIILERPGRHGDVFAMSCLGLSLASSSIGIPFAVGVATEILVAREGRRRLWIAAAPLALFLVWYLVYGRDAVLPQTDKGSLDLAASNLPLAPSYIADSIAASFGGLVGLGLEWGRPLALVSIGGLIVWMLRPRPISPRLAMLLVAGVTYWGLAGLYRSHLGEPAASRYVYFGVVLIVLVGLELARGARTTPRALAVLGLVAAFAAAANFNVLKAGSSGLQETSRYVSAELGAVELAKSKVDPGFRPELVRAPQIYAGKYLAAVDELGSPADSPSEIDARPELVRQAADLVLARALGVRPEAIEAPPKPGAEPGAQPAVEQSVNGQVVAARPGCVAFRPAAEGAILDLRIPDKGLFVRATPTATADARLRAFGHDYPGEAIGSITAGTTSVLAVSPATASHPWHVRLSATGVSPDDVLTACGLGGK
jgi:hypothetical protein